MSQFPIFEMPPRLYNASGAVRMVGVEVEFGGLDIASVCARLTRLLGGTVEVTNRFSSLIRGARLGDWRVEIDSFVLTQRRYTRVLERLGVGVELTDALEDVLETVARAWIPNEIVSPPFPMTDLPGMETIRRELWQQHADGTGASLLYTFGLQFNPEIPGLDAPTITRYLRAFLAVYDWIVMISDIDFSRRLSAFVDPFPEEYRQLVLDPAYTPDMDRLIDDYLRWNPSRNRALDMLPAFRYLAEDVVTARAEEPDKIKARPTFHYRLPNSRVDDPSWSFALEWNRWVEVERLAEDAARLEGLSEEVLAAHGKRMRGEALRNVALRWGLRAP